MTLTNQKVVIVRYIVIYLIIHLLM